MPDLSDPTALAGQPPPDWLDWHAASALQRVATAHAVHAHEAAQALDDTLALAAAHALTHADHAGGQAAGDQAQQNPNQTRVQARAWWLGRSLGLPAAWAQLRRIGWGAWAAAVLLVVVLAAGMAAAVMGEGARINLLGALVSLLGMNALVLLLWLASVLRRPSAHSGGGLLQALVAWGARRAGQPAQRLLAALVSTLGQARATPWLAGLVSHSAWALGFALLVLWMGFGFAFRAYQPVVETTILSPGAVQGLVNALGWLPEQLGTPKPVLPALPDQAASGAGAGIGAGVGVGASASDGGWAWWLMACVFWYGLVPRLLLTGWCAIVLRRKLARLQLPEADPGYQWALARFKRLAPTRVIDADASSAAQAQGAGSAASADWGLLLYELPAWRADDAALWRSVQAGLQHPQAPAWAGSCDGSAEGIAHVRADLARQRPLQLVLAVPGPASPDRSVARFVRHVRAASASVQLQLMWPADWAAAQRAPLRQRWQDWLQAEALDARLLPASAQQEGCP
jgi:hypothetical protein